LYSPKFKMQNLLVKGRSHASNQGNGRARPIGSPTMKAQKARKVREFEMQRKCNLKPID